jgi:hypothetical protein
MTTELFARLPEWEAEAESFERKARALRQIIEGVKALNGDAAALLGPAPSANGAAETAVGPRGLAAVRLIVADRPGTWKLRDLKRAAKERGFPISENGVEKAVGRMTQTGEAKRMGYGRYRFKGRE